MDYRVDHMAGYPDYVGEVAQLRHAQWQHPALKRPHALWVEEIRQSSTKGVLPMTLVALRDAELLGFVTLVEFEQRAGIEGDMWLITLCVKAQHRGAGPDRSLIERRLSEAENLEYSALHLWTQSARLTKYCARVRWPWLGGTMRLEQA